jgi:hypothetical protein
VHHIVFGAIASPMFWNCFLELFYFQTIQDTVSSFRAQIDEKPNNVRQAGQHSLQKLRRKHTSTIHHNLENPLKTSARSLAVQIGERTIQLRELKRKARLGKALGDDVAAIERQLWIRT